MHLGQRLQLRLPLSRQCSLLITQHRQLLDLHHALVGYLLGLRLALAETLNLDVPISHSLVCRRLGLAHRFKVHLKITQGLIGRLKCCLLHAQTLRDQLGLVALRVEAQKRHWPQGLLVKLSGNSVKARSLKLIHRLLGSAAPRGQGLA